MLQPIFTKRFNKSVELCKKRGYDMDALRKIMNLLMEEKPLPPYCRPHKLHGNLARYKGCHVKDDWVILYSHDREHDKITFGDTGTHADVF